MSANCQHMCHRKGRPQNGTYLLFISSTTPSCTATATGSQMAKRFHSQCFSRQSALLNRHHYIATTDRYSSYCTCTLHSGWNYCARVFRRGEIDVVGSAFWSGFACRSTESSRNILHWRTELTRIITNRTNNNQTGSCCRYRLCPRVVWCSSFYWK